MILSCKEKIHESKNILESTGTTMLRNKIIAKKVTRWARILEIIDNEEKQQEQSAVKVRSFFFLGTINKTKQLGL